MTLFRNQLKQTAAWVRRILGFSAWRGLLHSDMHACFLTIFFLLLVNETKASSYDFFWKILALTASLGLYIVYMFLVNDYCDITTDKIAGEKRKIHDVPITQVIGLILLIGLLSFIVTLLLIGQTLYTLIYVTCYFLATFYSAPPLRLKGRGILGTVCAALVEKPLPCLLIFAFFQHFHLDTLIFLSLFSVMQIEMITHHQFLHYEGDVKAQVKTYVVEIGPKKTLRILDSLRLLVALFFFMLLGVILIEVPYSVFFLVFLSAGYFLSRKLKGSNLLVREPGSFGRSRFYMQDATMPFYYSFLTICLTGLFPLFLGLILTLRFPQYILLLLLLIASQYYLMRIHYQPFLRGTLLFVERMHRR